MKSMKHRNIRVHTGKRAAVLAVCGILAAGFCLSGCRDKNKDGNAGKDTKTEVQTFAAASLNNALTEIASIYEKKHSGVKIVLNADSSGTLMTQIQEGYECDIFFSAAEKQMNQLKEDGYIESDTVTNLLRNEVVLITPKGSGTEVTGFEDVTKAANFALAADSVPVGQYSREIFTNLGILDEVLKMEINECANVSAVTAAVSEGSNEIGTVYATDAYSVIDKVDILASAPEGSLSTEVIYPAARVKNQEADDAQKTAADEFFAYLKTEEAKQVFETYLFVINE